MTQFTTRDGRPFEPKYLLKIDPKVCIGCGRCFKVCSRDVMTLRGMDEDGQFVDLDDEDDGDIEKKVMLMVDEGTCIGCGAALGYARPARRPTALSDLTEATMQPADIYTWLTARPNMGCDGFDSTWRHRLLLSRCGRRRPAACA